jgi:hypothetical protein
MLGAAQHTLAGCQRNGARVLQLPALFHHDAWHRRLPAFRENVKHQWSVNSEQFEAFCEMLTTVH